MKASVRDAQQREPFDSSSLAAHLTVPTHGVSGSTLALVLQAGEVMHELLHGPSCLRRQSAGREILHCGTRGE
jgi:hypothetical protein